MIHLHPIKNLPQNHLLLAIFFLLISCGQDKKEATDAPKKMDTPTENQNTLKDKSVSFLWREDVFDAALQDTVNTIFINEAYCQTISEPERAALGFVSSFVGSECEWDGEYAEGQDNLKCKISAALRLGYQCSDRHLSFLRKWFQHDSKSLTRLQDCSAVPFTASAQESFDEIRLMTKGDTIKVSYEVSGINMRMGDSWHYKKEDLFVLKSHQLYLVASKETEVSSDKMDLEEEE